MIIQILFSATGIALYKPDQSFQFITTMFGVGVVIPLVYITGLTVYKILPKSLVVSIRRKALQLLYATNNPAGNEEEAQ